MEVIIYYGSEDFGTKQFKAFKLNAEVILGETKVVNYRLALYLDASLGSLLGLLQSSASGVVL